MVDAESSSLQAHNPNWLAWCKGQQSCGTEFELRNSYSHDHSTTGSGIIINTYTVSKNVPPLVCYNFDIREHMLIFLAEMLSK